MARRLGWQAKVLPVMFHLSNQFKKLELYPENTGKPLICCEQVCDIVVTVGLANSENTGLMHSGGKVLV